MSTISRLVLSLIILFKPYFVVHIYSCDRSSLFHEWPIEKVAVVSCDDGWTGGLDVLEEMDEKGSFVGGVDDGEWSFEFRFGSVIEIINVAGDDFTIRDQESLMLEMLRWEEPGHRSCKISSLLSRLLRRGI